MVFWMAEGLPQCRFFEPTEMSLALAFMNDDLRKQDNLEFVGFVSQHGERVGRDGVDTIKDGKTPDGHPYEWSKQHRGAGPRKEEA